MREKVAGIVANKKFMVMLSNGSQARKTHDEKELVLLRIKKEGVPAYFVASLRNGRFCWDRHSLLEKCPRQCF